MRKLFVVLCAGICAGVLGSRTSRADVNLKNGNYNEDVVDFDFGESTSLSLNRTYNSKSDYDGLFGFGWGSALDTRVDAFPDGTLQLLNYGSGRNDLYAQSELPAGEPAHTIELILEKEPLAPGPRAAARERLTREPRYRHERYIALVKAKKLPAFTAKSGAVFHSQYGAAREITRTDSGYVTSSSTELGVHEFDDTGRVTSVRTSLGKIRMAYRDGRLRDAKDDAGHEVTFEVDAAGKVTKATSSDKLAITYRYGKRHELLEVQPSRGASTVYAYDARLNVTSIVRGKERTEIGYQTMENLDRVRFLRRPNGLVKAYSWIEDEDQTHSSVGIELLRPDGGIVYSESHANEYDANGRLLKETTQRDDEAKVEETYDPRCYAATRIVRGKSVVTAGYDANCQLVRKETNETITTVKFDATQHVTRVDDTPKDTTKPAAWATFVYDGDHLTEATDSSGTHVKMTLDKQGRLVALSDGAHTATIAYGANGAESTTIDGAIILFGSKTSGSEASREAYWKLNNEMRELASRRIVSVY